MRQKGTRLNIYVAYDFYSFYTHYITCVDTICSICYQILKSGQSHTRFFKTGCTAIELEAEIVDESFCEEVEEVEDTRVMPNDAGVDGGVPKEDKGKKNKKNKKDRQKDNIWTQMPSWRVPGWGRRKRATQNEQVIDS